MVSGKSERFTSLPPQLCGTLNGGVEAFSREAPKLLAIRFNNTSTVSPLQCLRRAGKLKICT